MTLYKYVFDCHTNCQALVVIVPKKRKLNTVQIPFTLSGPLKESQPCPEDTPAISWHHDSSHCHAGSSTVMPILGCVHSEAGFLQGTSSRCNPLFSKVSCTRLGGTRQLFCLPSSPLGFLVDHKHTTNSISCCSWDNSCSRLPSLNCSHICCMSQCRNPFT